MSYFTSIVKTDIRKNGYVVHKCTCSCGNVCYKRTNELSNGSKMCPDCARRENGKKIATHGMCAKNLRLFSICRAAWCRCNKINDINYHNYGGRGIEFKFDSLEHMFNWSLENGYRDYLSIDRIDVNGNYEPSNCSWVTIESQATNKRNNVRLGDIVGIPNISKFLNITEKQLGSYLYKKKLTIEEVYELYKNDKTFHMSASEKRHISLRKRKDQIVISKDEAIEICENIKNGSNINRESKRLSRDYLTIKRAIKRLEDGFYD